MEEHQPTKEEIEAEFDALCHQFHTDLKHRKQRREPPIVWPGPGPDWEQHGEAWHCGTDEDGCGVFLDEGTWRANVVRFRNIWAVGSYIWAASSYSSKEEAMEAATAKWKELVEYFGE